eukprot:gene3836-6346_t
MEASIVCTKEVYAPCAHIQLPIHPNGLFLTPTEATPCDAALWDLKTIICPACSAHISESDLAGHNLPITASAFSPDTPCKFLCTASEDTVLLWQLSLKTCSRLIEDPHSPPQHVVFNNTSEYVSVSIGCLVYIFRTNDSLSECILEGHDMIVQCAAFSSCSPYRLVTADENRRFKIWDVKQRLLFYQSQVEAASPFTTVTLDKNDTRLILGETEGKLHVFQLSPNGICQKVIVIDCKQKAIKLLRPFPEAQTKHRHLTGRQPTHSKHSTITQHLLDSELSIVNPVIISSAQNWQQKQQQQCNAYCLGDDDSVLLGTDMSILSIVEVPSTSEQREDIGHLFHQLDIEMTSPLSDLQEKSSLWAVATPQALLLFHSHTFECLAAFRWNIPADWPSFPEGLPATVASCTLCSMLSSCHICCEQLQLGILAGAFERAVHVVAFKFCTATQRRTSAKEEIGITSVSDNTEGTALDETKSLSIVAKDPLEQESPLHATMKPAKVNKTKKTKSVKLLSGKKLSVGNQPVTFHRAIKSSGYTAVPRQRMFQSATLKPIARSSRSHQGRPGSRDILDRKPLARLDDTYPTDGPAPTSFRDAACLSSSSHATGVLGLQLTTCGEKISTWMSDYSVHVIPSRKLSSSANHCVGVGHNSKINNISWSYDGNWLLSCEDGEKIIIWSTDQMDAIMTMNNMYHNFKSSAEGTKLKQAQFYYSDQFILAAHGGDILLYKYHFDPTVDELKRYLSRSRYKLVTSLSNAQAHPSIYANIFAMVFDEPLTLARACIAQRINCTHARPIYKIRQNLGSPVISHPPNAYNLYLSGSYGDGVGMWDVRTNKCVRRFTQHTCRAVPVGFVFSPCGRFVACGSEDKVAVIYDVRQGLLLHKLTGHRDVVTDVAFHPTKPMVCT